MITFWNRREVFVGYGLSAFNMVRDILDTNKIKYVYKYGKFGGATYSNSSECYIYVHKKDYELASFLLRDIRK